MKAVVSSNSSAARTGGSDDFPFGRFAPVVASLDTRMVKPVSRETGSDLRGPEATQAVTAAACPRANVGYARRGRSPRR